MAFASKISSVALLAAALPWETMFMQAVAPSASALKAPALATTAIWNSLQGRGFSVEALYQLKALVSER